MIKKGQWVHTHNGVAALIAEINEQNGILCIYTVNPSF